MGKVLFITNGFCLFLLGALAYALLFGEEPESTRRVPAEAVQGFYVICTIFFYIVIIYFLLMINAKESEVEDGRDIRRRNSGKRVKRTV